MVRQQDWKALFINPPFGNGDWQLFNLKDDPAELHDLTEKHSDRLGAMVAAYDAWAIDQNIIPPVGSRDGREFSMSWFYDERCDWWCEARFDVVDLLMQLSSDE